MRNAAGAEMAASLKETIVFDDPEAMCRAALLGLGVTLIACAARAAASGERRARAAGAAMVRRRGTDLDLLRQPAQLPAKTRVFVDFVVDAFRRQRLAERFAGSIG